MNYNCQGGCVALTDGQRKPYGWVRRLGIWRCPKHWKRHVEALTKNPGDQWPSLDLRRQRRRKRLGKPMEAPPRMLKKHGKKAPFAPIAWLKGLKAKKHLQQPSTRVIDSRNQDYVLTGGTLRRVNIAGGKIYPVVRKSKAERKAEKRASRAA